ncbi:MAG: phosphatidylserine decarboxylase [Phycisphaerae bacterium]|jgi:phosphatidylserine decarboxylase
MLTTAYARTEITLLIVLGGLATAVVGYYCHWWGLLPAFVALSLLSFYRHPRRQPPPGDTLLLAPADGHVVEITRDAEHPDGGRVLRIMIFLAVYDVHVNRSPCAGRVTGVTYRPGRFLNALRTEADAVNECNTVELEPVPPLTGPVRVRQIAGVLARRIVCRAQVGDELAAGQPFGMIKLGSRTEVCVPEDARWEVAVAVGEKVRAGLSILARWTPPQ